MKPFIILALTSFLLTTSLGVQAQKQAPPPGAEQKQPECVPVGSLPADIKTEHWMPDLDGDLWVVIRVTGTGKMMLGYINIRRNVFCPIAMGKVNPAS